MKAMNNEESCCSVIERLMKATRVAYIPEPRISNGNKEE
jgi:hypothetical protein